MKSPSPVAPLRFSTAADWEAWLAKNHAQAEGVWLQIAKKGSAEPTLTISDALDVALCYGWIDSQRRSHDAGSYLQRYSRRRAKSPWSKLNVARVKALTRARRMRPAGIAEVDAAKADGRWAAAYASPRDFVVPAIFTAALKKLPQARTAFARLSSTQQYALLLPLLRAVTPKARQLRLEQAVTAVKTLIAPPKKSRSVTSRTSVSRKKARAG